MIGQSQGAGAAIYTARYATEFGGRGLDYRGAVGTGTPAYVENVVGAIGPGFPELSPGTNAYLAYIFASLRRVYPGARHRRHRSPPAGRKYLGLAETRCVLPLRGGPRGVDFGGFFTRAVSGAAELLRRPSTRYLAMPETGFDKPFFMGHGRKDADVPYALTIPYVRKLQANDQPLTFKTYDSDHSGTLLRSQKDTHPFVRRLFRRPPAAG